MIRYRGEIDGLRALAVIPVILFHAGFKVFSGGFVGVDVFFVISGYLITTILITELEAGTFSIIDFYERRMRRILPALFMVMACCLPFAWLWLLPKDLESLSRSLVAVVTFVSNVLFWQSTNYFDTDTELKPLLHTWSLAVEEQYYVLFPLLLMLTQRLSRRWIFWLLATGSVGSLMLAQYASTRHPMFGFYLLPTRAWELLIGAMVAIHYPERNIKKHNPVHGQCFSLAGFALIAYSILRYNDQTPFPGLYALAPTVGAALIIVFANHKTVVGGMLGSKLFVMIGLTSYSAYLWHQPLFALARYRSIGEPAMPWMAALAICSLALGYLSWRFIERPFRNRHVFSRNAVFWFGLLGSALFSAVGLVGIFYGPITIPYRYSSHDAALLSHLGTWEGHVWTKKNLLELSPFDASKPVKLLIIGDSNSGDLINALFEDGMAPNVSVSSFTIYTGCGNLALDKSRFSQFIDKGRLSKCKLNEGYADKVLHQRINEASQVILTTRWTEWEAERLDESLGILNQEYGHKFLVVGTKSLMFKLKDIIAMEVPRRYHVSTRPDPVGLKINGVLQQLRNAPFVNPYDHVCKGSVCDLFDEQGNLIYFDGFHVTNAGAMFYARRLKSSPYFHDILH